MYCNSYDRGNGLSPAKYEADSNLRVIPYLLS
jgi:hypothetical protein